jgi:hypothetical protein
VNDGVLRFRDAVTDDLLIRSPGERLLFCPKADNTARERKLNLPAGYTLLWSGQYE